MDRYNIMVGDLFNSTFSSSVVKITEIQEHEGYVFIKTKNANGANENATNLDAKDFASLIPIPLTKEILKLNGFNIKTYSTITLTSGLNIEVCLDADVPIYVEEGNSWWHYSLPHVKYVHEFQHLLRLLGEKTYADNFIA